MTLGPEIAILLERYHAVYIEIPKVACTSMKVACAALLHMEVEAHDGSPHETLFPSVAFEVTDRGPLYPGLFSFAFVRNPWDRIVSCYRDKILLEVDGFTRSTIRPGIADCLARFDVLEAGMPFDAFVEAIATIPDATADAHFRSQYTFVTNRSGDVAVDFIGRYENLTADLAEARRRAGIPRFDLPRLQANAARTRYAEFYDSRSRDMVADRYHKDIDLFGYRY